MKRALQTLLLASLVSSLAGCAATVPVKVAAKTTKLGVKATTTTVKAGAAIIPDGSSEAKNDEQ